MGVSSTFVCECNENTSIISSISDINDNVYIIKYCVIVLLLIMLSIIVFLSLAYYQIITEINSDKINPYTNVSPSINPEIYPPINNKGKINELMIDKTKLMRFLFL